MTAITLAFVVTIALGSERGHSTFRENGQLREKLSVPVSPSELAEARRLIDAGDAKAAVARLRALPSDSDPSRQTQVAHLLGVAYYHADETSNCG